MKFFVDENIPLVTANELRAKGYDVADIRGSSEQGMPDEKLWLKVQEEKRLLITTDKGFSNHRDEPNEPPIFILIGIISHANIGFNKRPGSAELAAGPD